MVWWHGGPGGEPAGRLWL